MDQLQESAYDQYKDYSSGGVPATRSHLKLRAKTSEILCRVPKDPHDDSSSFAMLSVRMCKVSTPIHTDSFAEVLMLVPVSQYHHIAFHHDSRASSPIGVTRQHRNGI